MPYLVARPALRRLLKESAPTVYETGLLRRLASHAGEKPESALQNVETIFAANFLEGETQKKTFDQLWSLQKTDGPLKGGWYWYDVNLDPYETLPQFRYGAALAALAIGGAPTSIREAADVQPRIRALTEYLNTDLGNQSLHVRLAMLWASTKLPSIMSNDARAATIREIIQKQRRDGGWTLESLGPWNEHPSAPPRLDLGGSDSYATAFTTFVLEKVAGKTARAQTEHALDWLKAHQDRQTGAWPTVSMNKTYPAGSMQASFLQDAATAFAAAALAAR
jgi:squalene-hopene/tetraprenyl-beta-curcumene cyclase